MENEFYKLAEHFKEECKIVLTNREEEIAKLFFEYGFLKGQEDFKAILKDNLEDIDSDSVSFSSNPYDIGRLK